MGIFEELKQRRLVQIVISYLAAGWVILGVVDQFVDRGVLPEIFYFVALIWYLGGIPAAFLIGWNHGEKGAQRAPRSEVLILSALGLAAVGLSGFTIFSLATPEVDLTNFGPDPNRVAVLYFEDRSAGGANQYLADGLTVSLIDQLRAVPALDVISRNGVAPFQGSDISRDSISRLLEVGTLVGGAIEPVGDRLQVHLQLYDGASGAPLPDGAVSLEPRSPEELVTLREELGEEAGRLLRQKLGANVQIRRRASDTNVTAWTLLQRADRLRREGERMAALDDHDLHDAFERFDAAHALLEQAAQADTLWAEPLVLRSQIEYQKSRLTGAHASETERHIEAGLAYAERALDVDAGNAAALAIRGTLKYWKHLLNIEPDDAAQAALVAEGQADLEQAVRLDPALASAYSVLAHLYFTQESVTRGVLAAQRAYDADAYLDVADVVIWRLYSGNLDLQSWTEARKWCDIGERRFPEDPIFAYCRLQLMATPAIEPDPDLAWQLAARVESIAPPTTREYERLNAVLTVGGILGRAGLQDSARAVLDRASRQITHEIDVGDDLGWREAQMRILAGQKDQAIDILRRLITANPEHAFGYGADVGWRWRELESDPAFEELRRVESH